MVTSIVFLLILNFTDIVNTSLLSDTWLSQVYLIRGGGDNYGGCIIDRFLDYLEECPLAFILKVAYFMYFLYYII